MTLTQDAVNVISQYSIKLTVRQIYYRLVSAGIIKNTRSSYNGLDKALVNARLNGSIPFDAIVDHTRNTIEGDKNSYETPEEFMKWRLEALKESASQYKMPYWYEQPQYIEVWVEKDALSSLMSQVCSKLHVNLNPCRGYPSISFLYAASERLGDIDKPITILYFGDFDMRGKDIERYLTEMLKQFGVQVDVHRIALTSQQIEAYQLPPQPAKQNDTMAKGWIEKHGNVAWELDALEPNVLMRLLEASITEHIDADVLQKRNELLGENHKRIDEIVSKLSIGEGVS